MLSDFFFEGRGKILEAIRQLFLLSQEDPSSIIDLCEEASRKNKFYQVPLAIAILLGRGKEEWIISNKSSISSVLLKMNPDELILLVDFLKKKDFGRGLGSRNQKIIRETMERWEKEELSLYRKNQPTSLYRLVRLIHPRYQDHRGGEIKLLLRSMA